MPIKACRENDEPGFKWGDEGKCFTYIPGQIETKEQARTKAVEQGRAIEANKSKDL